MTRECRIETEEILSRYVNHILIEVVQNKCRVSSVGLSTVYEHERLEMFELADSIICTPGSLLTFFTQDTNSYVSLQYHTYVICTIANRQRSLIREFFSNHSNDVSFLFRGYSAGENDVRKISCCQELVFQVWIRLYSSQGITGHNDSLFLALSVGLLYLFLDLLYFWE